MAGRDDILRLPGALGRRYLLPFDTGELAQHRSDVLVVGSGIAGLTAVLTSSAGRSVSLVTKAHVSETNTWYAQGGIAGAVGEADSVELHVADTLEVGQGLCEADVVRAIVGEAPAALAKLAERGVVFDLGEKGEPALAREGGHSLPRVLHAGDATGAEIQNKLAHAVRRLDVAQVFEERFLVDLLTAGDRCVGALVLDPRSRALEVFWADAVILATGGCGQLFRVTTNPRVATGDGVAAAWRAGARVGDLEFVQFHPTALDAASASPKPLMTEALRGEGAYLLDAGERRFMLGAHEAGELAPRDVVTREIQRVMQRDGAGHVWLDARHLGEERLRRRFPQVWQLAAEAGFDLAHDLVPVAPAAHYAVGGVVVDIDGRTSVPGLYASGECACTGLHGANRLASNSLLEGLVTSRRISRVLDLDELPQPPARVASGDAEPSAVVDFERARGTLQSVMSDLVGVVRSGGSLEEAAGIVGGMARMLDATFSRPFELELQNLATLAVLLTHAAWLRTETRGVHARSDFPERDDGRWRVHTVWRRGADPAEVPVGELGRR
ncbi:MAG TPA: L-aspartate oxidase [Coriobacteriia bacterium]|jgi:L-aspartate oxidase